MLSNVKLFYFFLAKICVTGYYMLYVLVWQTFVRLRDNKLWLWQPAGSHMVMSGLKVICAGHKVMLTDKWRDKRWNYLRRS